jgi:hypothetical protein
MLNIEINTITGYAAADTPAIALLADASDAILTKTVLI